MKIILTFGTRPHFIKLFPLIKELKKNKINYLLVHTGQHYSFVLDKIFFQDLHLAQPKYDLKVGSGSQAYQTAEIIFGLEKILLKEQPNLVMSEGDTNSDLATALTSNKLLIPYGHIEAGLRSFDREMPEEINRIVADHLSEYLFAPTKVSQVNLLKEGIESKKIFVVGNLIVDAVYQSVKLAEKKSKILSKLHLKKNGYFLVTAHRQENVDNKEKLSGILKGLELLFKEFHLPVIYSLHPRTKMRIKEFKLKIPSGIKFIEPVGYFDFLKLEANSLLILTDSGGIQEESSILRKPCVTLRENTERPETIAVGSNMLAGTNPWKIVKVVKVMLKKQKTWPNPFGDGKTAKRIVQLIKNLKE